MHSVGNIESPRVTLVGAWLILTTVLLATWAYRIEKRSTTKVPGPWHTKWTSLALTYYFFTGRRAYYVHELHNKYGPIVRLAPDEIDVTDIAAVKEIYSVRETFLKSPWYRRLTLMNHSMFNTNNVELHRKRRRLLSGPMSESALKNVHPLVLGRVELAIERMKEEANNRGTVDVFKWWLFMATDIIGELSFGESFHALETGQKTEYIQYLENEAALAGPRTLFPSLVLVADRLPLPARFRAAFDALQQSQQYAKESIARHKRIVLSNPNTAIPSLFSNVFKAEKEDRMTLEEIVPEAQSYIVAGSDTTSNTLTYLVWSVCSHPHIRDALVKELSTLPGGYGDSDLKELSYLGQVIDETLRLYSAAPSGLPRVVPPGGAELVGHHLDGGVTICAQAFSMHRNPHVFPEPESFKPERWAEPVSKLMRDSFMPWGGGARICIGLHLARMELRLATAKFFLAFPFARVSSREGMSDGDMVPPNIYFLISPPGKRCLIDTQ